MYSVQYVRLLHFVASFSCATSLRSQSFEQKTIMCREIIEHIYPHLQNGSIKPIIDRVFELDEVASAHDHMQSGAHMGKIILRT